MRCFRLVGNLKINTSPCGDAQLCLDYKTSGAIVPPPTNHEDTETDSALQGAPKPHASLAADAAAYLERGSAAIQGVGGIADEIDRQAGQLTDWAKTTFHILPQGDLGDAKGQGAEHEVFYNGTDDRAIKRTYPGTFGVTPAAKGIQCRATPLFYLRRLELMNRVFGSDMRFEVFKWASHLLLACEGIIRQWSSHNRGFERQILTNAFFRRARISPLLTRSFPGRAGQIQ